MAFRMTKLSFMRTNDRKAFDACIKRSLTKHYGVLTHSAADLDVSLATLKRWVNADRALALFLERVRAKS